ncbi:MAG: peptide chain release factor N(5)-glutamine methyltransferase [Syntrophaceae bacterium]|nr:peptide chain release factor N(5)-glutamine methyltransferase [Syntrophaceae bacterium]
MMAVELLNWSTNLLRDHGIENPRLQAELLLAHSLNLSREGLYGRLHSQIEQREMERFEELIRRRISGVPLQYILGHQEFWSIDLKVDPRVLIPRPETEVLVEQALEVLSEAISWTTAFVLEIGTGSGAVAISLAKEVKDIFLVATDISEEALRVARENARSSGVLHQIGFVNGNLFEPFNLFRNRKPFDLILSNPPYIATSEIGELAREVKDHEPTIALNGGEDGLAFYRAIIAQAPLYLKRGGWLLLEVGQGQAEKVSGLMEKEGDFLAAQSVRDLLGIERVVKAQRR